jgi:hypothetical protein
VTRFFFPKALKVGAGPVEATPTEPATYPPVLDELLPAARHDTARYSNYRIEGPITAVLEPGYGLLRGLKRHRCARTIATGHAFVQNLRRGHLRDCDRTRALWLAPGSLRRTRTQPLTAPTTTTLVPPTQLTQRCSCEITHFEMAIAWHFGLPRPLN